MRRLLHDKGSRGAALLALAVGALVVLVSVIVLRPGADRSTTDRVADWMDDLSCASVDRYQVQAPVPTSSYDAAVVKRAERTTSFECNRLGGASTVTVFTSAVAARRALAVPRPTRERRCLVGATVVAEHLLGAPGTTLRDWCEQLHGRLA